MVVCAYPIFFFLCSCSLLFFTAADFLLAGPLVLNLICSPPLWISMFFFLRNSSPLFSITRSNSFSVIHVSVNIKNNADFVVVFSFYKSGRPCDFLLNKTLSCIWVVISRSVYRHVITKFSRMGRLPHFLHNGAPPARRFAPRVDLRFYKYIAGLQVTSRWPLWWSRRKVFLSYGD